jgi:REP element-mobilizing transposase RayT
MCFAIARSRINRGDRFFIPSRRYRTGHFWEKRYFCDGFSPWDKERELNTLRYIHGNPKVAKMRSGFFYEFSNYGSYDQLTEDGLTQWHPAFLQRRQLLGGVRPEIPRILQAVQPFR